MKDNKLVTLNKQQISETIQSGDTCMGAWYLAVSLEGIPTVYFAEINRQWNYWGKDDYVIGIPHLYGEGSGGEYEAAIEVIDANYDMELKTIQAISEQQGIGLYDYIFNNYPEELEAYEEASTDYYLNMFIEICNGLDGAMDDWLTWGYTTDEYDNRTWVRPPFIFKWDKE